MECLQSVLNLESHATSLELESLASHILLRLLLGVELIPCFLELLYHDSAKFHEIIKPLF